MHKSRMQRDSKSRPKVSGSRRSRSGVRRKTAAAIEGSVKCRVGLVRMAVRDLSDGLQAGRFSVAKERESRSRYGLSALTEKSLLVLLHIRPERCQ